MLEFWHVPRLATLDRQCRLSLCLMLGSAALAACTQQRADDESRLPLRQVQDSGQNRALSFDGLDDYATTGTAQFPIGSGTQTISAWFEVESIAGKHALITLRKDGDSGIEFALQDGLLGAWRTYGNRTLVVATTPVTTGVWHHAAYTFDGTTNQIYLDGALVANSTNEPNERTPTTCWLGTLDGTNDLFKGTVDDFRVFNVARSSAQIAAEAAGNVSSDEPGLVLYLPCNELGGNLIYDHSPLANDGQLGDGIEPRLPRRVASGTPDDGT